MKKRQLFALILTAILAAAHFLRYGALLPVLFCILFPFIVRVRKPWAWWTVQIFATGSALLWLSVAYDIATVRLILGEPWTRMAVILGTVALFSLFTAGLFWPRSVRNDFGLGIQT